MSEGPVLRGLKVRELVKSQRELCYDSTYFVMCILSD